MFSFLMARICNKKKLGGLKIIMFCFSKALLFIHHCTLKQHYRTNIDPMRINKNIEILKPFIDGYLILIMRKKEFYGTI